MEKLKQVDLAHLIEVAAGRVKADLVLKNCQVVDVTAAKIRAGDLALVDGYIAGVGNYEGQCELDMRGLFAVPAFIDSHIHIESAFVTPEEISRLLVPCGTGTIIADPHEIVNVAGLTGLEYMLTAAAAAPLNIEMMLPSCVPATPFEHAGAVLEAEDMVAAIQDERILGLGEMMNFPGVVGASASVLAKLELARKYKKPVDGHSPGLSGKALNAYAATGIMTDHECSTIAEMEERLANGMYVLLRRGSACHDLDRLLPAITALNSRRCLLCSDDRQPQTILSEGHIDDHLRRCVKFGLDPLLALQMATLNAAEAYGLQDRGALLPGRRADICLLPDLVNFRAEHVFLAGEEVARAGQYLPTVARRDISPVASSFKVSGFSLDRLKMQLKSPRVKVIEIVPGGVVTASTEALVQLDETGDFVFNPEQDVLKLAVIERHHGLGQVGLALLGGYGMKRGAIALSIAHDSHNIIVAGCSNAEMYTAVAALLAQNGGVVLVEGTEILAALPLPVAGLMSPESGEWVKAKLEELHRCAHEQLGVSPKIEAIMTLCFMSLPVIPSLKLTDMGLFDVTKFDFVPVEC